MDKHSPQAVFLWLGLKTEFAVLPSLLWRLRNCSWDKNIFFI